MRDTGLSVGTGNSDHTQVASGKAIPCVIQTSRGTPRIVTPQKHGVLDRIEASIGLYENRNGSFCQCFLDKIMSVRAKASDTDKQASLLHTSGVGGN